MSGVDRPHGGDACGGDIAPIGHAEPLGECPSCGVMLMTSNEPNPHNGGQVEPTVIHPIPFCTYFGETSADAIVHDILIAVQAKAAKA